MKSAKFREWKPISWWHMKLLEHDAWECFDMQHSHEAMTYQDEVVDGHEPAKKMHKSLF